MKTGCRFFKGFFRIILPVLAVTVFPLKANAQAADPMFTQYWTMPTLLNPAATGDVDFLRIHAGARLQWIGITNAPKSFVGVGDMPFKVMGHRVGAGLTIVQESLGLFSNLLVSAQGSYKFQFKFLKKGMLSAGLQIGYYNSRFRGSDVYIPDGDEYHQGNDPSIPMQDLSGNAIDFSLALNYYNPVFHVGLSGMHLTNPKVKMSVEGSEASDTQRYETELPRALYFDAGGNIALRNTLITLQPSLLLGTDFTDFAANITMRATYNKFITFGVGYRWNDAISIMIGAEYKNFFLGYAYDYSMSAIGKASTGSHEIVAGYQLKIDMSGKNKNKHRSIRIM